jgi:hypothetical protein
VVRVIEGHPVVPVEVEVAGLVPTEAPWPEFDDDAPPGAFGDSVVIVV